MKPATDTTLLSRLSARIDLLDKQIRRLASQAVARAEIGGAVVRITQSELPAAGKAGRLFFVSDLGADGVLAYDTGTQWLYLEGTP